MKQLNPANVLAAIRDREANTVEDLCTKFGLDPSYGRYYLANVLRDLNDAGLILHEGVGSSISGRIEVIPNLRKMQAALGFSLKTLGQAGPDSLTVQPHFGKPAGFPTPLDVFVVMAFKPALRPIYDDHILKVTKSLNLVAQRGDDFFTAHHIMSDVWEAINAARLVIADCTGRNPNVFYEIGMAHTLGRTVVMITQDKKDVPFDLQSIRFIPYEYTPPGMMEIEEKLTQAQKAELGMTAAPAAAFSHLYPKIP